MGRSPSCSKEGLKRGAWTAYEDKILAEYIAVHGEGRWRTLPKKAGLQRCGKSCRLRWLNYLRPDIKRGNISPDEEELIIRLHKLLGNRWSLIAGRLPGRTDNEIKNYWNTNLGKKVQDGHHQTSASHGKGASATSNKENTQHKSEASNVVYTKAIKSTNVFVIPQQTSTVSAKGSNNSELPLAKPTNLSATSMANAVESNVEGDHGMLLSSGEDTSLDMMVDPFDIMGEFSLTDILDSDLSDANHDFNHFKGSIYDPYLSVENSLVFSDDEVLQDWTRSCNYFQTNVPTIKDQSFSSCLFFDGEWLAE